MSKLLTVNTAEASDIWPNGSGYSREVEDAIIKIARTEISADDVARSGLVFSQWYIPYYLAEGRWRQRQEQQAEQKEREHVTESANARRIARLEKKLADSIQRINGNFKGLDSVVFGEPADDPNAEPQLIRLIRSIAWDLIHEKKVLRDAGIWDADKLYGPGAATTHAGALWVAQQENKGQRPGDGVCWRLSHKSDIAELRSMVRDVVRDELHKQTKGSVK